MTAYRKAGAMSEVGTHHVDYGRDGAVEQKLLVWRDGGVCDCPPQVAGVHILPQLPVIVHIIEPHTPVILEGRCTAKQG